MTSRAREYARRARKGIWGELRTWLFMTALVLLILFNQSDERARDRELVDGTDLVTASVEIVRNDAGEIELLYRGRACQGVDVFARWKAVIRDGNYQRLATRRGDGDYLAEDCGADPTPWRWQAFFEGDLDAPPTIPEEPFRVCVSYRSILPTDVVQRSGPFCSDVFDPNQEEEP